MPPSRRKQNGHGRSPSAMTPYDEAVPPAPDAQRSRLPNPYSLVPPGRGDYSGTKTFRAAMRWMLLRVTIILVSKEYRLKNRPLEVLCPACDQTYKNQIAELVRHAFAHLPEGLRPLQCSLPAYLNDGCTRRFAQASDRTAHETTHYLEKGLPVPEERKTPCGIPVNGVICPETFSSPSAASRHRSTRHLPSDQKERRRGRPGIRGTTDDSLKMLHRYWEQGGWREAFDGNLRDGFGPLGEGDEDLPKGVLGSHQITRFLCSPEQASASDEIAPSVSGSGETQRGSSYWALATVADFTNASDSGAPPERPASTPFLQSPDTNFSFELTPTAATSRSSSYESSPSSYPPSTPSLLSPPSGPSRALEPIAGIHGDPRMLKAVGCRYDPPRCPWPPGSISPPLARLPATLAAPGDIRRVPTPPWGIRSSTQVQQDAEMLDGPFESTFEQGLTAQEAQVEAMLDLARRQREGPTVYKPAFSFA